MPGRNGSSGDYRYGFNGMEKDDEVNNVTGSSYTATFWKYDSRLGRRWERDPVVKHWRSSYDAFSNNPISRIDPNGDDDYYTKSGQYLGTDFNKSSQKIRIVSNRKIFYTLRKSYKAAMANGTDVETAKLNLQNSLSEKSTLLTNYKIIKETDYSMLTSIAEHLYYKYVSKDKVNIVAKDGANIMEVSEETKYPKAIVWDVGYDFWEASDVIQSELENKFDIISTLRHESFHYFNHSNATRSPEYGDTPQESQSFAISHLDAYRDQLSHYSWKYTSEKFKKSQKANIEDLLKYVVDRDKKKSLEAEFDGLYKGDKEK